MDELFVHWLSQKETMDLIPFIVQAVRDGTPTNAPPLPPALAASFSSPRPHHPGSADGAPASDRAVHGGQHRGAVGSGGGASPRSPLSPAAATAPPRSPNGSRSPPGGFKGAGSRGPQSPRSPGTVGSSTSRPVHPPPLSPVAALSGVTGGAVVHSSSPTGSSTSASVVRHAIEAEAGERQDAAKTRQKSLLPKFYIPGEGGRGRGRKNLGDLLEMRRKEMDEVWSGLAPGEGIGPSEFVKVTRDICGFPAFFNRPLMRRINELYNESGAQGKGATGTAAAGAKAGAKLEGGGKNGSNGSGDGPNTPDTPSDATLTVSLRQVTTFTFVFARPCFPSLTPFMHP